MRGAAPAETHQGGLVSHSPDLLVGDKGPPLWNLCSSPSCSLTHIPPAAINNVHFWPFSQDEREEAEC